VAGDYIDLDSDLVANSGRATAATSTQWEHWASRTETLLRNAAADSHEPVVNSAFEEHLSQWNPRMKRLASNADALGTNAVSAARTMDGADTFSASMIMQQVGEAIADAASHLRREITSEPGKGSDQQ
jgi:hypothetical protein